MLVHKPQSQGYNKCVHGSEEPKLCLPKVKISESFLRVYLETIKTTTFPFLLDCDTLACNPSDRISSGLTVGKIKLAYISVMEGASGRLLFPVAIPEKGKQDML